MAEPLQMQQAEQVAAVPRAHSAIIRATRSSDE
jgi:hypothetical protein